MVVTATKARTWVIDEAGRPWLHDKRQRQRGQWRTCPHCSETFPALPRATYCGDSLRLAEFMYENPGPALSRKRDIFAEGRRILPVPPTRRAS